jgi:hypothetical protein
VGGVFELGAVEEAVMGVVIDATTDEVLVLLLEDTRKRDDEAAGTMLDTDVLREAKVEASIAEVGNAEACVRWEEGDLTKNLFKNQHRLSNLPPHPNKAS